MNENLIENSVYFLNINSDYKFIKQEATFKSIFNRFDQDKLIEIYSRNKKSSKVFNGVSVRLEGISKGLNSYILNISKINYFDLLLSNILYLNPEKWLQNCINEEEIEFCNSRLKEIKDAIDGHQNMLDIIGNKNISNIMAVSVLIEDRNGKLGIVRRASSVNLSTGFISTSVTGSVDGSNFECEDPLVNCVMKEALEELGLNISKIKIIGVAISKKKLQPIFLFDAKIDESWEELIEKVKMAEDYQKEIDELFVVSIQEIPTLLCENELTDATRYHIYLKYKENKN